MSSVTFLAGYTVHPWRIEDVEEAVALMNACDMAAIGLMEHPLEEVRADWEGDIPDPDNSGWLVRAEDGLLVAIAEVTHTQFQRFDGASYIHPDHRERGLEEALLGMIEAHAVAMLPKATHDKRVVLRVHPYSTETAEITLLVAHGFVEVRRFLIMQIVLPTEPLPIPEVPTSLTLRPFEPERDALAVHAAQTEAFGDHWGSVPRSFEEWSQSHMGRRDFDPSLWFVVTDGEQIAGAIIGSHDLPDVGFVSMLGVRRAWRGRGVGMILLQACFRAMQTAGKTTVALGVDADNTTGAVRLYERAGMHAVVTTLAMQKELRAAQV